MTLDYLTRDENGSDDDPIVAATSAVEEMRSANETFRSTTGEELQRISTRLTGIETRLNRPGTGQGNEEEDTVEQRAFDQFMRHGGEALGAEERRALTVSDSQAGGYLAPESFETEILRELVDISPIRAAATVRPTSRASVIQPKLTERPRGQWVGEIEERPETDMAFGQIEVPVHEMACWIDVSNQLLEDSAVNLESELSSEFAIEFGRLEGEAFVNGNGVKKPIGLMTDAKIATVPNGHATNLDPDALIGLMYSVPAQYRRNGSWLMNGPTIATARKLKDGQDNYLWQPSYQAGQPETLLGRPIIEAVDLPDIEADAQPIAFGDIGMAYRIYDRVGLSVLRDPYTQATRGITRFHARRRVGGAVIRPDAVRKLAMTA